VAMAACHCIKLDSSLLLFLSWILSTSVNDRSTCVCLDRLSFTWQNIFFFKYCDGAEVWWSHALEAHGRGDERQ